MRCLGPLLFAGLASVSAAATFTWTGAGGNDDYTNPANWAGGVVPANDGSATIHFSNQGSGDIDLPLFGILDVASISIDSGASYSFEGLALIHINVGLTSSAARVTFSPGIALSLDRDSQSFNVTGTLEVAGSILGLARLSKTGSGDLILSGISLYSGGTRVESGSLTFTSLASVPVLGTIRAEENAYVGITFNNFVQAGFIDHLNTEGFYGHIGLDTAAGGSAPAIFSETLDLSSLGNYAGIGTRTSARITGSIQVGAGRDYRFGGGAGTLYVESDLTSPGSNIDLRSAHGSPLSLILRGNNTFGGHINILNSVLVLDSAHALPGTGTRLLNLNGPGYAGYTENHGGTAGGFLSRLGTIGSTQAIVGIDSANTAQPRIVSDAIDLSIGGTRTDPYYLGTSSRVTLTGSITPTTGDSLYLTAVKGGHLTVASRLGDNIPGVVIGQTNSFDPQGGTVELTGANVYAGGTQVLGGTLIAGHNSALGLGGVTVADRATLSLAPSIRIGNSLTLSRGATLAGYGTLAAPGGTFIGNGAILSPGSHSEIGTLSFASGLTLGAGGRLNFNLLDPAGLPGSGWDSLNITGGSLDISATIASPFTIHLATFASDGASGPVSIFDPAQSYSWTFATAAQINGFSSDLFAINSSGFLNNTAGGSFFVTQNNTGLAITFTPVPEPSTYLLMGLGLGIVVVFEYRRRRR